MPSTQFSPLQPIGENIHFFQPPEPAVMSGPALISLCAGSDNRQGSAVPGYRRHQWPPADRVDEFCSRPAGATE